MFQVKTWFQNRRAKWRRLKQDGQDGEKENDNRKLKNEISSKPRSDDENTSTEEESTKENTEKEEEIITVDAQKLPECKTDQVNFCYDKSSCSADPYSSSLIGESSYGLQPIKETGNAHFQSPNFSVTTPTTIYHRNSTINPLGQSFYPTQVMPHHQTYQPPSYHQPNHDFQSPIFSSNLPLPTITSSSQFDAFATNLTSNQPLSVPSLMAIESPTE